ncbi:MAG: hypothetical protein P1U89_12645 [Verrucomicrobiales bacterium]|nr:hypothetical protein [Verrucomicrobiales bacterium]
MKPNRTFKTAVQKWMSVALVFTLTALLPEAQAQSTLSNSVFQKHRKQVEASVERGLTYLSDFQRPDGTYDSNYGKSVGIVSLAGMAFLSAGHTPGYGKYAKNIDLCIDYVLESQKSNGLLDRGSSGNGLMYAHNIATLFLSECSGMLEPERQETLEKVLGRATEMILRSQAVKKNEQHTGGWRYKPDSRDSDLSCSGWALMALRSAKLNGAQIPDEAIDSAVKYVLGNHDTKSGRFGYHDAFGHSETLTGCGLLCLELCGLHGLESNYRSGDYILEIRKKTVSKSHEFYGNYYNAQAMFQLGGSYWEKYADWMYEEYMARQGEDGGWNKKGKGKSDAYTTSMVILSFTVPYRQLPIYQRDETVDEN